MCGTIRDQLAGGVAYEGPAAPEYALRARVIAQLRGIVRRTVNGPKRLNDFAMVGKIPVAFVRLRFANRLLIDLAMIARLYREEIGLLRMISRDKGNSLELWLRSRYGTWRANPLCAGEVGKFS